MGAIEARVHRPARSMSSMGGVALTALALFLIVATATGYHLHSLMEFPLVSVDETNLVAPAWALAERAGLPGLFELTQHNLGFWSHWLSLRLFGVDLFSLRAVSYGYGTVLIVTIFLLASKLYGSVMGLLAATLVVFSPAFAISSHIARYDIIVAVFAYAAIVLHLHEKSSSFSVQSVLSGLLIGLAFDVHPNAILFAPVILCLHFVRGGVASTRSGALWGFVGGLSAGLTIYVLKRAGLVALAPAFGATQIGYSRRPPIITPELEVWHQSLADMRELFLTLGWERIVLLCVALALFCVYRTIPNLRALTIVVVLSVGFAALLNYKGFYYRILISPAVDIAICGLLSTAATSRRIGKVGRVSTTAFIGAVLLLSVISTTISLGSMRTTNEYDRIVTSLKQALPIRATILGDQTFWFGLHEYDFISWWVLPTLATSLPDTDFLDVMMIQRPDYVLIGPNMERYTTDDITGVHPVLRLLCISRADLDGFLAEKAVLAASVPTESYGLVRLYRIEWSPDSY